ncbi:MAG: aminotransferase class I/II-fold pyridoxal phosphate-dependent enzyme [Ignavibacteria bacterium]|nr:aminotransferase class I/II-fold pyridoxal phosphate-dependent enzyme [Ignavibacteria bacterium]
MQRDLINNKRLDKIIQSEIRNMSIECERVGGINLSQGISNLKLSDIVKTGAFEAVEEGINYYTRYDGVQELRNAIAEKAFKYNGIECHPDKNIIVSGGATGAFYCACLALMEPGDEVIIFEPYYGYHINTLYAAALKPVYVEMTPPDWSFRIEDLERAITPKTRAIMINTPANPSGKIFSRDELLLIGKFCDKHDLIIFTDEIYEYFLYDGNQHISPASLTELKKRTITISGYSKTFSITGWRIGYLICDESLHDTIGYVNDLIYVCAPSPLQYGVAKGIRELGDEFYQGLQTRFAKKRELVCSTLNEIGLTPYVPQGSYYTLCDISSLPGKTGKEKVMFLLEETGVACVPGEAFFSSDKADQIARFCFAKDDEILEEACIRLKKL